jgi:hypothetical protein
VTPTAAHPGSSRARAEIAHTLVIKCIVPRHSPEASGANSIPVLWCALPDKPACSLQQLCPVPIGRSSNSLPGCPEKARCPWAIAQRFRPVPTQFRQSGCLRGAEATATLCCIAAQRKGTDVGSSKQWSSLSCPCSGARRAASNTARPYVTSRCQCPPPHDPSVQISTRKLKRKETTIPCMKQPSRET